MLKTEGVGSAAPHWPTQHRRVADGGAVPTASGYTKGNRAQKLEIVGLASVLLEVFIYDYDCCFKTEHEEEQWVMPEPSETMPPISLRTKRYPGLELLMQFFLKD